MLHVMVDLETLGNNSHSVITSMGAVMFDPNNGNEDFTHTFYRVVDPQTYVDAGMKVDVSTIMWWMQQSEQARNAICNPGESLKSVLDMFTNWYPKGGLFWGNGATFDNVILSNAYMLSGLKKPWGYSDDRCYRTLKNLYPRVAVNQEGTYHNALDDAINQAKHLVKIFKEVGLT